MGKAYGIPFAIADAAAPFIPHPSLDEAEATALAFFANWPAGPPPLLWRVEAVSYATPVDRYESDEWTSTPPRLELFYCSVKKWTPHGATLYEGRWVDLRPDRKQWASRTPAEALAQFAERRRRQIHILERQLRRAKAELHLAEPPKGNGVPEMIRAMKGPWPNQPPLSERPY